MTFVPETRGEKLEAAINNMKDGDVVVFENTRFEDLTAKRKQNDPELGKYWASLGMFLSMMHLVQLTVHMLQTSESLLQESQQLLDS